MYMLNLGQTKLWPSAMSKNIGKMSLLKKESVRIIIASYKLPQWLNMEDAKMMWMCINFKVQNVKISKVNTCELWDLCYSADFGISLIINSWIRNESLPTNLRLESRCLCSARSRRDLRLEGSPIRKLQMSLAFNFLPSQEYEGLVSLPAAIRAYLINQVVVTWESKKHEPKTQSNKKWISFFDHH